MWKGRRTLDFRAFAVENCTERVVSIFAYLRTSSRACTALTSKRHDAPPGTATSVVKAYAAATLSVFVTLLSRVLLPTDGTAPAECQHLLCNVSVWIMQSEARKKGDAHPIKTARP